MIDPASPASFGQRRYSVDEIDRMRLSVMYLVRNDERKCEDRLRTYMLNGTEPEELQQAEAEEVNRRVEAIRAHRIAPGKYVLKQR